MYVGVDVCLCVCLEVHVCRLWISMCVVEYWLVLMSVYVCVLKFMLLYMLVWVSEFMFVGCECRCLCWCK